MYFHKGKIDTNWVDS